MNYIVELVPDNLNFSEEIARIIGFSAITSVNLDVIPKPTAKGEKVRYEGFAALAEILKANKFNTEYITNLKAIHDTIQHHFSDLIQINYTPNFITFTCVYPKGRSKTFLFVRFKKNNVQFEFSGKTAQLIKPSDLTGDLMQQLVEAFNNLSQKQI
jgi:hypothetical protein